jgi:arylsulfatase A-like enzyme
MKGKPRDRIIGYGSIFFISLMLFYGCKSGQETKKPNIIYVLVDQLRYQSCGFAGDTKARTPNIDELAQEGVIFSQAISNMPVCAAYRASLFTGKYTTSTGMVINELRMNTNHECLAQCFSKAGYYTGYIGKWHLYANQLGHHNDPKNSYIPPGPDRLGFDDYWAAYNFHHQYYNTYFHTNSPKKIYYGENVFEPDAQTDMAIEYIRDSKKSDKPFFLFLSIGTPHDPWKPDNVPEKYLKMFKDVAFPVAQNYKDANDPYGDAWSNLKKSPELIEEWMRVYYAMTANIDWNIGRLLEAIKKEGIEENTIIVFTSDHGEMFGAQGRMKKNTFYEEAARIPFIVKWPLKIPKRHISDACLGTVDIMPTLLSFAGLNIPEGVEGMDLSHCAMNKKGPEPEAAFLQNTGACAIWEDGHEWRALRDKQFTYAIYRVDGEELLFDNINDPYQMTNLVNDPQYLSYVTNFRMMLKTKMETINDTFEASSWYHDNWIKDRIILRTATLN